MNEDNTKTAARTRRMPFRPPQKNAPDQSVNVLPIGTYLGEFEILDLIGEGGFGIVYLAYDHSLERQVALKEYMPSGLATRTHQMNVTVRSQHNLETFTAGLKSFINEARMLAQFDSPALVKVHLFWEGNGTAYMVMPFYEGVTLKQALKDHLIKPTEGWIRLLLADLFDAIDIIHRMQCLHRDIAPDNILLLKDGRPLLLDFGAARRVIGDLTQCLTAILKPGFAPIEQYADIARLRQGAWTDIYALAAVVYYLITGKAPPPAVARLVHDELVPAREAGKGRYSDNFLAVLDKALAVRPEHRYQSIGELRRALNITETIPRTLPHSGANWSTTVAHTAPMDETEPRLDGPDGPDEQPMQPTPPMPPMPEVKPAPKPEFRPRAVPPARENNPSNRPAEGRPIAKDDVRARMEPRLEPKLDPDARLDPAPEAKPTAPPDSGTRPGARRAAKPAMQSFTQMAGDWKMPEGLDKTTAVVPKRDRLGWMIIALLLSVGIVSGVYLGSNRTWDGLSKNALNTDASKPATPVPGATASSAATGSTGSSGASDPAGAAGEPASAEVAAAAQPALPPAAAPDNTPTAPPVIARAAPSTAEAGPATSTAPPPSDAASAAPPAGEQSASATVAPQLPSEVELWRSVSKNDKASGYQRYLKQYPKGQYAPIAKLRLDRLQAKAAVPAAPPDQAASPSLPSTAAARARLAEEESWTRATTINNAPAYREYLSQYPTGGYAALARDRLASLQPSPPSDLPRMPAGAAPRALPESIDRQAGVKPQEPGTPTIPKQPAEAAVSERKPSDAADKKEANMKPEPDLPAPPTASGGNYLRMPDQLMTGTFTVDPRSGAVSGVVKIVWNNGDQFEGTLVRGSKEGRGKFIWNNGQHYTGDWNNDMPNGKGMIVFPNGSRYEGEVKDGVPHGKGVTRFKGGDVYSGDWVRGKSHGQGRYTWSSGGYWEGEFRDDKRTENGKLVYADGSVRPVANGTEAAGGDAQRSAARTSGMESAGK